MAVSFRVALVIGMMIPSGLSLAGYLEPVRIKTLSGDLEGKLVKLTSEEIELETADGKVVKPLADLIDVRFGPSASPPNYTLIELNDGTLLHGKNLLVIGDRVKVTLFLAKQEREVEIPLGKVTRILKGAEDAGLRFQWDAGLKGKRGDVIGVKTGTGFNCIEVVIDKGDETGKALKFELAGKIRDNLQERIVGMHFFRKADLNAPPEIGKLYDSSNNVFAVKSLKESDDKVVVATVVGYEVELPKESISRLDLRGKKLVYLTDDELKPTAIEARSNVDAIGNVRMNVNLDGGPLQVLEKVPDKNPVSRAFSKGMALHAYSMLTYDLKREYNEFRAVLGVDPEVGKAIDSQCVLLIYSDDNKEPLFEAEVTRKRIVIRGEAKQYDFSAPVRVNISNVNKLRIEVKSMGLLDLGNHVNLVDALVSK